MNKYFLRKLRICTVTAIALATSAPFQHAYAQSSVTLYGLLSTGLVYISNAGGQKQYQLANGPQQLPRVGFKGSEDLGGGNTAVFVLENGFSLTNGTLGQGGRMFGRQAFVGLSSERYGSVTLGRQYEEMSQQLWWTESASIFAAFGAHIGDSDNIFDTVRLNNAVRYASPTINGLSFAGSYAFSNATNGFSNNNSFSFGANYAVGALKVGAALTQFNHPASTSNTSGAVDDSSWGFTSPFVKSLANAVTNQQRIFGVGASYDFSVVKVAVNYSNVLFNYADSTGLRVQNGELSVFKYITPALLLGTSYIYTAGNYSVDRSPHWHQVNAGADYFLSKRTDLYLVGIFQRAGGAAQFAQIYSQSSSTSKSQAAIVAGIRSRF
ncbi:porin [Caballeronia sp. SBC2]|uniref:porin n=1 Tax=Caballeronia sp. SBC2 TaxID=2705547 RepID=UPI0013E1C508|nr:porin [Caballeronia sp. SBC2]QIE30475.1 Gram-negative porin [Caballeronia sp. SBC2]